MKSLQKNLTLQILMALLLGVLLGFFLPNWALQIQTIGQLFVLALKMLIMPLIFATMIVGVTSIGSIENLGSLGKKTIVYYIGTTGLAILVGLFFVNTMKPGVTELKPAWKQALQNKNWKQLEIELTQALNPQKEIRQTAKTQQIVSQVLQRVQKKLSTSKEKSNDSIISFLQAEWVFAKMAMKRSLQDANALRNQSMASKKKLTVERFIELQIEKTFVNPFEALSKGNVLGVLLFAIFFGIVLLQMGEKGKLLIEIAEKTNDAMMIMVQYVMKWTPLGVFSLMATQIAKSGLDILVLLGHYMICVLLALLVHGLVVLPLLLKFWGKTSPWLFFTQVKEALGIAFSTSSSSATLPVSIRVLSDNTTISKQTAGFVLPLGSTVNMDGTALYEAVAALFIAQLYGIDLSMGQQVLIFLTAALAAIGAAGIPSAGTVTMVMVFSSVGLPLTGIGLILAVDRILDMCRTTINVWGDLVGAAILDRWDSPTEKKKPL